MIGAQARHLGDLRVYDFSRCDVVVPYPWVPAGGTNGSRINGDDNVEAAVAPRINVGEGVLIEAEAADLVEYPNDQTNAAWNKIGVTINLNAALSPRGLMEASEIILGGAANDRLDQAFPITAIADAVYNYAVWLKGTGSINIGINTTTGIGGSGEDAVTLTSEWARYYVPVTYVTGATGNVRIHGVIDRAGGPSASVIYMWNPQVTAGPRPSSDVLTVSSALTRTADLLTCTDLAALGLNQDAFTIFVTAGEPYPDPAPGYPMILRIEGDAGAVLTINKQPDGQIEFQIYDGSVNVSQLMAAGTPGTQRVYAIGYSRAQQLMRVAATGTAVVDATGASLATLPALGTARLGSANGFWWINQVIAQFAIAPRLMTEGEILERINA